jgi:hypothetical protein
MRDTSPCIYQICGSLQATSSCNVYDRGMPELAVEA